MLISEEYRKLNAELHATKPEYGTSGWRSRNEVRQISDWGRKAILDYGCGRQTLSKALGRAYHVTNYDPCISGLDAPPEPHPVVVCGDVLEHVEPDCLADVLADLRRLTTDCIFARMALTPSTQTLSDGRNAHLILESPEWWVEQFTRAGFVVEQVKPKERTKHTTWLVAH